MRTSSCTAGFTFALLTGIALATAAYGQDSDKATVGAGDNAKQERTFTEDPRLDLTPAEERTVYQSVTDAERQEVPENFPMTVGAMIPKSMELKELPSNVKQMVASIKNYKYVKLEGDKLLLIDPTNRVVMGIVTKPEGTTDLNPSLTVGSGAADGEKKNEQ